MRFASTRRMSWVTLSLVDMVIAPGVGVNGRGVGNKARFKATVVRACIEAGAPMVRSSRLTRRGRARSGARRAALGVAGANRVEHRDELFELGVAQGVDRFRVARVDQWIEPVEQSTASGRHVTDDLPPIGRRPLALDQS